jgi:alginate O-acetyltransferase complex protein AlgI
VNVATPEFALFVAGTLAIFYLLPARLQNPFLLLASYAYYATWSPVLPAVLAATTVLTWSCARWPGRGALALGVAGPVLLLVGVRLAAGPVTVVDLGPLPRDAIFPAVGIAYFVLQAIGLVADSRRGRPTEASLLEVALFLGWFPKLTAGPIESAGRFLRQLRSRRVVDDDVVARASALVLRGLFRKLVLSATLVALMPGVLKAPQLYTPATVLAWAFVALVAVYADFAGYTDIVRGVSLGFGLELAPNFRQPLLSRNSGCAGTRAWAAGCGHTSTTRSLAYCCAVARRRVEPWRWRCRRSPPCWPARRGTS